MKPTERSIIVLCLLAVGLLAAFDIFTDLGEGIALFHLVIESIIVLASLVGVFVLLLNSIRLRNELEDSRAQLLRSRQEADEWRAEAKRFLEGLSDSIDRQMSKWGLTPAEKEVAFLLLKGLSLKDVAAVRGTSEKTARIQSLAIYSKSGLSGRSELAAFFLEDLLVPSAPKGLNQTNNI